MGNSPRPEPARPQPARPEPERDAGRQIDRAQPSEALRRSVARDIERETGDPQIDPERPPLAENQAEGGPPNPGDALIRDRLRN